MRVLLDYFRKDYRATLAKIANLTSHGEITFELLYAILIPRTILITECPVTGEPRALQLLSATRLNPAPSAPYVLLCENVDSTEEGAHPGRVRENATSASSGTRSGHRHRRAPLRRGTAMSSRSGVGALPDGSKTTGPFGRVQSRIVLPMFKGTEKINSLEAFPIEYHHDPEGMRRALVERGRKWAGLRGIHHVHYSGTAALVISAMGSKKAIKYNVSALGMSRIRHTECQV